MEADRNGICRVGSIDKIRCAGNWHRTWFPAINRIADGAKMVGSDLGTDSLPDFCQTS